MPFTFTLDGREVVAGEGQTIWDAAREAGIHIPALCHTSGLEPVGVCRACVVEIEGARVLAASCVRTAEPGMRVRTASERCLHARRMIAEMLLTDHPSPCARERIYGSCELEALGRALGVGTPRLPRNGQPGGQDLSSPVIAVDLSACILCDRCVRACDEIQVNDVIGRHGKGHRTRIGFDHGRPMGQSTCVSCGECAAACPTGALVNKPLTEPYDRMRVRTAAGVCPYCGVGCGVEFHVQGNTIVEVRGRSDDPVNRGRLCVKGRYGFDFTHHPQRLTKPLIRVKYPKAPISADVAGARRKPGGRVAYEDIRGAFREATWDEALDLAARRLMEIRDRYGPGALAGFGSAKCTNEEAYLFQKLVRAGWGTNNVDHCTRLCHASSVAALLETIGSGAVSNIFADALVADAIMIIGSDTTANHPVAATFFKQAARRGAALIVVNPREIEMMRYATHPLVIRSGSDVALLNAMMHVIIEEGLTDEQFIRTRTEGYDALRETVRRYSPESVEPIVGVPAGKIREAARAYGRARNAMIFWGMGISQHTHGTDNARCLISLCLITGNIGRRGTGLHPLRGQNNVQGASDAGLIPMVFPGYQSVEHPEARARFERAWGRPLDPRRGLTVVEIMNAALEGRIRGMYMMGENPFLSDPNINKVRKALASLEFLVVQDIFPTETAEFADVILPAASALEKTGTYTNTDRRVQIGRKVVEPPGEAREDWQIICDLATRMGYPMSYSGPEEIFAELCALNPDMEGMTYESLGRTGRVWPRDQEVIFERDFPNGRGKLVPCEYRQAQELPDDEYPFVLNTGRLLQHWHTGTMTRRAKVLDEIEPVAVAEIHPDDAARLGLRDDDAVRISSRRGSIVLAARITTKTAPGTVFVPFHFREAAANVLTIDALDPYGKIPEFKFCAVRVERAAPEP